MLQTLLDLGLSAILLWMLWVLWKDRKELIKQKDDRINTITDQVLEVVKENTKTQEQLRSSVKESTKATETLTNRIYELLKG